MARRTRSVIRPAPRTKVWIGAGIAQVVITGGAATLFSSLNAIALALRPFTILRTRMVISVQSDQVSASEFASGVFSMQVVTDSAVAAGATAVPTPLSETEAAYFVYQPWFTNFVRLDATGFQDDNGQGNFWVIDSKAQRKVGLDDDVANIIQVRTATGVNLATEGRILLQLH